MISFPASALGTLLLAQAADTVYVVQQKPGWLVILESAALIIVAIGLLALGGGAIFAGLKVKQLIRKVEETGAKVRVDLKPAIENVNRVSGDVAFVSQRVRQNADQLSATVTDANERLRRAADVAEERVGEFNALLGVVQEEAESLFITGASTARGLRAGADAFQRFQLEAGEEDDDGYEGDGYDEYVDDDELRDEDLRDEDLTDEELEIRVARRDARGIDPDRVF